MNDELDQFGELRRALNDLSKVQQWYVVGAPWGRGDFILAGSPDPHRGRYVADTESIDGDGVDVLENAAYIAAANPMTVRKLLAELDAARAAAEKLRADQMTEQHRMADSQPASVLDMAVMQLAESVGLIGPASRVGDLHAAIQRFHDLICVNATIKAAVMAADVISGAATPARDYPPLPMQFACSGVFPVYSADQMRAYVDADRAARAPADGEHALYTNASDLEPDTNPAAEDSPLVWVLTKQLTKRETTTRGYLWFGDPGNCMWTPLYTRAARAPADSVTAPAAGAVAVPPNRAEFALQALVAAGHVSQDIVDAAMTLPGAPPADSVLADVDPLQGAANWLAEAHGQFCVAVLQWRLMIGYNRAKRLHDAAIAARKQGANHD